MDHHGLGLSAAWEQGGEGGKADEEKDSLHGCLVSIEWLVINDFAGDGTISEV
jgi:hypothetical protein